VNQFIPSIRSLFDVLASEMQSRLFPGHAGDARVSWGGDSADRTSSDLIWWSWSLSIDPACRVLAGASLEAWKEICGLQADVIAADFGVKSLAAVTPVIQEASRSRFGSEVTCEAPQRSEEPPNEWTAVPFAIKLGAGAGTSVHFSISPDLEAALGGPSRDSEGSDEPDSALHVGTTRNSAAILMHVEMPVTIVLGRTKMRLKDLLKLTNGSVVELDQALDDEVEIRVNNCVIAYGQVVAVDGNYAVRVLRMASARKTPDLRGILPEKAA
jgi:flagellar motor switch protein FliN